MNWEQVLAKPDDLANPDLVPYPFRCQALRSLRRYPLPLQSGREAKILQHFGDGLCRMLDERLQQHLTSGSERLRRGRENPLPPPGALSGLEYFSFKVPHSCLICYSTWG